MNDFLTPTQVAAELKLGKSTVYRGLEDGRIPGTKICGRWRTLRSQLVELVRDGRVPMPRAGADPMPVRRVGKGGRFRSKAMELSQKRAAIG